MARYTRALLVLLFCVYRKYIAWTKKYVPVSAKYIKGGKVSEKTTCVDRRLPSTWSYAKLIGPRNRPYPKPAIVEHMDAFIFKHGDSIQKMGPKFASAVSFMLMVSFVLSLPCLMYQPGGGFQPGPRGHSDGGNLTQPPKWSPEMEDRYPFRLWVQDVQMWSLSTNVEPHRHGPLVVMNLGGSAKAMARELDVRVLIEGQIMDMGDGNGAQPATGLSVLINMLKNKFAPLHEEMAIRAMSDMMAFTRLPHERIDEMIARFDTVRYRSRSVGNMPLSPRHAAWMLMQAMRISPQQWLTLLQPLQGGLPNTEQELDQLVLQIRRHGHIYEAGTLSIARTPGTKSVLHAFPTFGASGSNDPWAGGSDPWGQYQMQQSGPSSMDPRSAHGDATFIDAGSIHAYPTSRNWQCSHCGACEYDGSTDTSSDDGEAYDDPALSNLSGARLQEEAFLQYKRAKKSWRRLRHSAPRRYRRFGKGKGGGHFFGKGKSHGGKGKGKSRTNPRDATGQIMKCSICGSETHFRRECPRAGAQQAHMTHAIPQNMSAASASGHGVGLDFTPLEQLYATENQAYLTTAIESSSGEHSVQPTTSLMFQGRGIAPMIMEQMSNMSSEAEGVISSMTILPPRTFPPPSPPLEPPGDWSMNIGTEAIVPPTPTWSVPSEPRVMFEEINTTPVMRTRANTSSSAEGWEFATSVGDEVGRESREPQEDARQEAASSSTQPSTRRSEREAHMIEQARQLNVIMGRTGNSSIFPWFLPPTESVLHARTQLTEGIGIIVDIGAVGNLAGSTWMSKLVEQSTKAGFRAKKEHMRKKLDIQGVGHGTQTCEQIHRVPIAVTNQTTGQTGIAEFQAPVIPNSEVPGLLGLESLKSKKAVVDVDRKLLICPGPGGVEMQYSPGTRVYQLEEAPSGHLLLPVTAYDQLKRDSKGNYDPDPSGFFNADTFSKEEPEKESVETPNSEE